MQHELDHLDGVLLLDHLDDEQRREAKKAIRQRTMVGTTPEPEPEPASTRSRFRLR
jgi:peptide deformylase